MKNIALLAALLLLSGCASVQETYAPDGRKAYALNCSGVARGWDKCQQAAGQKCGAAGYDVLDRTSEDMATIGGGSSGSLGGNSGGFWGSSNSSFSGAKTNERSMLIACKRG